MDRAERTGLGVAIVGHAALFAALSLSLLSTPKTLPPLSKPIDVVLVDEAADESTAPVIARAAAPPAPTPAPAPEPAPAAPPPPIAPPKPAPTPKPPEPKPLPKPTPKPVSKVTPKPQPKAAPKPKPVQTATRTKPKTPSPTDRLKGLNLGTSGNGTATTRTGGSAATKGSGQGSAGPAKTGAPAEKTAAQVRTTIDVSIDGAIGPFWKRNIPTGVEVEQLVTTVEIRLNKDGSLAGARLKSQSGKTDSNVPQQALHIERAIKSVQQAAPFNLPAEYYDQWRVWEVTFKGRGRL